MIEISDQELLDKYCIPNMGMYSAPGSELCAILRRLDNNHKLNDCDKSWIKSKGMFEFFSFVSRLEATGKADLLSLQKRRNVEQAKSNLNELNEKYYIRIYKPNSYLHKLVIKLDDNQRLSKKDVLWRHERDYFEGEIKKKYFFIEGNYFYCCFQKNKDPWDIINASSCFRKAELPQKSLEITDEINLSKINSTKVKSAVSVTRGGAYRDINDLTEALKHAQKAHSFDPKSFHPCTLYGAIYFELHEYDLGTIWFKRAEERGADVGALDSEIRSIFKNTKGKERESLRQHLLKTDPVRYAWAKENLTKKSSGHRNRRR